LAWNFRRAKAPTQRRYLKERNYKGKAVVNGGEAALVEVQFFALVELHDVALRQGGGGEVEALKQR